MYQNDILFDEKLQRLLNVIVELYIKKGQPIGSQMLYNLNIFGMKPSTLRKYMNILEKKGLLFKPSKGIGRIPTIKGFELYLNNILQEIQDYQIQFDLGDIEFEQMKDDILFLLQKFSKVLNGVFLVLDLNQKRHFYTGLEKVIQNLNNNFESVLNIAKFLEYEKFRDILPEVSDYKKIDYLLINSGNNKFNGSFSIFVGKNPKLKKYELVLITPLRTEYKPNLARFKYILSI